MWMRKRKTDLTDHSAGRASYLVIVDIVKAVSCIMIFFYHCNTILPGEWKFLTLFGQDLGNNLFFMVSGFALAPSIDATPLNRLPAWYLRRLVRIVPITATAYLLALLRGYYTLNDPALLFAVFIYPTLYWFITAILIFYIVLFLLAKLTGKTARLVILLLLAVIFILLYNRQERLYVIGLLAMIAGYMLRETLINEEPLTADTPMLRRLAFSGIIVFFLAFMAGELTDIPYASKGLILIGATGTGLSALFLGSCVNDRLSGFFGNKKTLYSFVRYLGGMALPLYLVQCFCSGYIGYWIGLHINFPLSFPVNFVVVWIAGTVLYHIEKCVLKWYTVCLEKITRK